MKIYYNPKLKQLARNLRNNSTFGEILLWNQLKERQLKGYQFMRQKPIGSYIVDFYCSKLKLAIEIDGATHRFKSKNDFKRQRWLESLGITVIRFTVREVKTDMTNVIRVLEQWVKEQNTTP